MAILLMLGWWYSRGWFWIIDKTRERLRIIGQIFAVKVLLRTWFSPWKQIYNPNPTFQTFLRDAVDNAVSRAVGGVVRTFILFSALILGVVALAAGLVSLIAWPFLPLLVIILPVIAIIEGSA
jgi:hypothetical protein